MLTKSDKAYLKENYSTKDDLKDLRRDVLEEVDSKLKAQSRNILDEVNNSLKQQLKKQKDEIVKEIGDFIEDSLLPLFDNHEKRISRAEEKLNLPPMPN